MANEIALLGEGLNYEQIAAMMGMQVPTSSGLPQLKVNSDFNLTIEGKKYRLDPGVFKIDYNGQTVYSEEGTPPKFRTFINAFRYEHYDAEFERPDGNKGAYVNTSIMGFDFKKSTEYLDEKGGVKCGKVKHSDDLPADQKAINKAVSCYRYLYGTVSFTGKTAQGTTVEVKDYPCFIKSRGNNFLVFDDEVMKALVKSKKLPWDVELDLTTTDHKNGATTYYVIHYSFDRTQKIVPTVEDVELFKKFKETIKVINDQVMEKHKQALRGGPSEEDLEDADLVDDFNNDDLDDSLPF